MLVLTVRRRNMLAHASTRSLWCIMYSHIFSYIPNSTILTDCFKTLVTFGQAKENLSLHHCASISMPSQARHSTHSTTQFSLRLTSPDTLVSGLVVCPGWLSSPFLMFSYVFMSRSGSGAVSQCCCSVLTQSAPQMHADSKSACSFSGKIDTPEWPLAVSYWHQLRNLALRQQTIHTWQTTGNVYQEYCVYIPIIYTIHIQ